MQFQLPFKITPSPFKITHRSAVLLCGSCFTEHIAARMEAVKMTACVNPQGILFNPMSMAACLEAVCSARVYTEQELFLLNETWNHWDFHSRFSRLDKRETLQAMNDAVAQAHTFLKEAGWLILTFGSAFQYFLEAPARAASVGRTGEGVGNCHKAPGQWFEKRLLAAGAMEARWSRLLAQLKSFNPGLKIVLTISPVRHVRDGLVENNRSKARLFELVQILTEQHPELYYFPAFELVNDVLRDYRFFESDMAHPNAQAVQYVWEQFLEACFESADLPLLQRITEIETALRHRPRFSAAASHLQFRQQLAGKIRALTDRYPYLDYHTALADLS